MQPHDAWNAAIPKPTWSLPRTKPKNPSPNSWAPSLAACANQSAAAARWPRPNLTPSTRRARPRPCSSAWPSLTQSKKSPNLQKHRARRTCAARCKWNSQTLFASPDQMPFAAKIKPAAGDGRVAAIRACWTRRLTLLPSMATMSACWTRPFAANRWRECRSELCGQWQMSSVSGWSQLPRFQWIWASYSNQHWEQQPLSSLTGVTPQGLLH